MKAGQYLTFKVKQNVYGLEIHSVREIKHMQPISALPDVPPYMVGVINLRDHIIPIMDLRIRLGVQETEHTKDTCIIVIEHETKRMGLVVDSVDTVTDLTADQIDTTLHESEGSGFVKAIGKIEENLVLLIEVKNCFLSENNVELLKTAA
ncbi:chemotaxis protein CheW [Peredibacter sp. HCB2-198]|uniref:chemotaxis protein CheW n=1 Tax=Peredibacter sp. HCB2-198 TaxID=3383025 RepID=UPI0038B521E7